MPLDVGSKAVDGVVQRCEQAPLKKSVPDCCITSMQSMESSHVIRFEGEGVIRPVIDNDHEQTYKELEERMRWEILTVVGSSISYAIFLGLLIPAINGLFDVWMPVSNIGNSHSSDHVHVLFSCSVV